MTLKSVLITGANRGLGLEFVRQLAKCDTFKPNHIFACCREPSKADELDQISRNCAHTKVHLVKMEVTDDKQISDTVNYVKSIVGDNGLNLLINNAGILQTDKSMLPNVDRENVLQHCNVNAVSPLVITQAFLPLLESAAKKAPHEPMSVFKAAVVNISSGIGSITENNSGSARCGYGYRLSKAALNMAVKCLSVDLKDTGILFTSFCPGWVQTDMGGNNAHLTPEQSISAMLKTMGQFNEKHNGGFYKRDGTVMAF